MGNCLFIILRWVVNALVLMALAYIIPGISVSSFWIALLAALVLGLVNAFIRPILIILTLPVNIITLGLFTLVINAFMFWIVSLIVRGFHIENIWAAFFGALIFWLVATLINFLDHQAVKRDNGEAHAKS